MKVNTAALERTSPSFSSSPWSGREWRDSRAPCWPHSAAIENSYALFAFERRANGPVRRAHPVRAMEARARQAGAPAYRETRTGEGRRGADGGVRRAPARRHITAQPLSAASKLPLRMDVVRRIRDERASSPLVSMRGAPWASALCSSNLATGGAGVVEAVRAVAAGQKVFPLTSDEQQLSGPERLAR